ncbi:MAG: COG4315 family predicted lipoprotein [Pelagimonas sp.]|uniref:COG4315 family predicted lipoprotein n=1 Tax=Pelagimonas sp. TaxID=2073170 RepID=UPI003D6A6888
MTRFMTLAAALTLTTTAVFADGHSGAMVKTSDAGYLIDGHEMTLYTFDKDTDGDSKCYGQCAKAWPPLLLEEGAKLGDGFATVARKNGAQQVTYNDQPLYLWVRDKKPGDVTGDGVQGVWHIARP